MKAFILLMLLCPAVQAMTIGIDQPDDGTKYAMLCEKVESILLVQNGDVKWGGLPTWKSVKGSARIEQCPESQGNWFELKTERLRNYQITVRIIRYDAEGNILSNTVKPPYFWFHGPNDKPLSPTVIFSI